MGYQINTFPYSKTYSVFIQEEVTNDDLEFDLPDNIKKFSIQVK